MTDQIVKQNAPGAVASLILGISSLVFGCFMVGVVLGIVGLVMGNKAQTAYNANPGLYTGEGLFKAGRITSIIGIVLGAIATIWGIISMVVLGGSALALFEMLDI